jgi:hypothetical protein
LRDLNDEIPVRGRDETDIDRTSLGLAESHHLAFLNGPQELDLHRRRDVADFIQEQCAALRRFEDAEAIANGPGEGAAHMAEELGLEERVGQRAAVDRHKRTLGARRRAVQPAGQSLLADAVFTGDEHRRVRWRDARREIPQQGHRWTGCADGAHVRAVRCRERLDPYRLSQDPQGRGDLLGDVWTIIAGHGALTVLTRSDGRSAGVAERQFLQCASRAFKQEL